MKLNYDFSKTSLTSKVDMQCIHLSASCRFISSPVSMWCLAVWVSGCLGCRVGKTDCSARWAAEWWVTSAVEAAGRVLTF